MKELIFVLFLGFSLFSCKDESIQLNDSEHVELLGFQDASESHDQNQKNISKEIDSIIYNFRIISMAEFTGVQDDKTIKSNEHVVIINIADMRHRKLVSENTSSTMDETDLASYLVGPICNDFEIHQKGDTIIPTGSLYEGKSGNENNIRAYLFLGNYNPSINTTIQFYDRIYGNGFIKRNLKK